MRILCSQNTQTNAWYTQDIPRTQRLVLIEPQVRVLGWTLRLQKLLLPFIM